MASKNQSRSQKRLQPQHQTTPRQNLPNFTATKSQTPQPLHSLLLVTRTRSGPRLALYYPPTFPENHPYFSKRGTEEELESASDLEGNENHSSSSDSESEGDKHDSVNQDKKDGPVHSTRTRQPTRHRRANGAPATTIGRGIDKVSNSDLLERDSSSSSSRRQAGQSSHVQKHESSRNDIGQKSSGPSLLETLPPYNFPFASTQEASGGGAGAAGGRGPLNRTSSSTKFKFKNDNENDTELQQSNASTHSATADGPQSKNQANAASSTQAAGGMNKGLRLLDGRDQDGRGNPQFSSQEKAESLAKLLAPNARSWHKRRFEVGMEDITFLGCPVFERRDGGWRSRNPGMRNSKTKSKNANNHETREKSKPDDTEDSFGESTADEKDFDGTNPDQYDEYDSDTGADETDKNNNTSDSEIPLVPTSLDVEPPARTPSPGTAAASFSSFQSSTASNDATINSGSSTAPESLTMFHLVFVVVPPSHAPGEQQSSLHAIYKHAVKPLTKALTHAQKMSNFVWSETRIVADLLASANLQLNETGGDRSRAMSGNASSKSSPASSYAELWESIAGKSELARAMAMTYDCVTSGSIAHLSFGRGITQSLQIPQAISTPLVLTPMSLQLKGLRPSTFNPIEAVGNVSKAGSDQRNNIISRYSAVLLLQDRGELLTQEIEQLAGSNRKLRVPLNFFVENCTPLKTLLQLSKKFNISLHYIQVLSMYLIRYRIAIATPPLHASNTYVVSPNADFSSLPEANQAFSKRFAMLPSLITILGKLPAPRSSSTGQGPQPWSAIIPSSDHKSSYMEILEWLLRGGWIMQLRTFCWVRVSARVKANVARIMRQEEEEVAAEEAAAAFVSEEELDADNLSDAHEIGRKSSGGSVAGDSVVATTILSPRLKPHLYPTGPPRPPSDAGSTSTARTAVRVSSLRYASGSSRALASTFSLSTDPVHEHRASDGSADEKINLDELHSHKEERPEIRASDFEPSIIASPQKANAIESRWLSYIASTLPEGDLQAAWPKLVKYFDGQHAIEEIAMREGWRRKIMTPILTKLIRDHRILLTVRHW